MKPVRSQEYRDGFSAGFAAAQARGAVPADDLVSLMAGLKRVLDGAVSLAASGSRESNRNLLVGAPLPCGHDEGITRLCGSDGDYVICGVCGAGITRGLPCMHGPQMRLRTGKVEF